MEEKELVQGRRIVGEGLEPLLDARDVAILLKISMKTVHKRVREGKLGCVQANRKDRKFTREQVQTFISTQSVSAAQDVRVGGPE